MISPSLALQGAIIAKLKATVAVTTLIGQRIYDRVPQNAPYPFVSIGGFEEAKEKAQCINSSEVFAPLHVWTVEPQGDDGAVLGQTEAKNIAQAIVEALDDASLTMPAGTRLVEIEHLQTRSIPGSDNITTHMVIEFTAKIDAA